MSSRHSSESTSTLVLSRSMAASICSGSLPPRATVMPGLIARAKTSDEGARETTVQIARLDRRQPREETPVVAQRRLSGRRAQGKVGNARGGEAQAADRTLDFQRRDLRPDDGPNRVVAAQESLHQRCLEAIRVAPRANRHHQVVGKRAFASALEVEQRRELAIF